MTIMGETKAAARSLQVIENESDFQDAQLLLCVSLDKLYGFLSNSWQRRVEGPTTGGSPSWMDSLNVYRVCLYCMLCY